MTAKNKKILKLSILGLFILTATYFQNEKEISFRTNRELTIGKLTRIKSGTSRISRRKNRRIYEFKYLVEDSWIKGQNPDNATWPIYYREGKAQIGKYYPVEFDKTDFKNSKILITKKPLTEKQVKKYLN